MHLSAKKKLTVIVVAVLMVSVSLLCCVEPSVKIACGASGDITPTTLTITTSNTTPAVSQSFTLSGTLKAGTTPIPGKSIVLRRGDPSGIWTTANTTTTDANGAYTFTQSESTQGNYYFITQFTGDTYAPSQSQTVSLTVG
jgi:hypothetical protein